MSHAANVPPGPRPDLGSGAQRSPSLKQLSDRRREKASAALTTSAAVPRLFLSQPGSLSVFSFGPTSGAQRRLIVRDWEPPEPPPQRCAAHAGNARRARS